MNRKAKKIIQNLSYAIISNMISLLVSILVVIIIPKLIDVEEYGFWQLFLFYSTYVGFLHFGWNDGIYLRYAGQEYEDLDKGFFHAQFIMLSILQTIILSFIMILSNIFIKDVNRLFVLQSIGVVTLLVNVRCMFLSLLQITNKIKTYAKINILERSLYFLLIITFLLFGIRDYKLLIIADIIGKLLSLLYSFLACRDIVFQRLIFRYLRLTEVVKNIIVGSKLMFANIASMLIIGVVRFGIEKTWSVATFAKLSLTLSISNIVMIFINGIGLIFFPLLKRTDFDKYSKIYVTMRDILMSFLYLFLFFYFPVKILLSNWLPQYIDSLEYMALIFPMFIYEGKMALLFNSYLKSLRKETIIFRVNFFTSIISIIVTVILTQIIKNLELSMFSITLLVMVRSIVSEIILSKLLFINYIKDIMLESLLTIIFIISSWFLILSEAIVVYLTFYVFYLLIKRKKILCSLSSFENYLRTKEMNPG